MSALWLRVGIGMGLLASAGASGAAPKARPGRPEPSRVVLPPNAPPLISVTARSPEYLAVESRLAQFIRFLQAGRRARAVELLSRRVTPRERRALIEKRWLRKAQGRSRDFAQILFLPDLQIRTREKIQGDTVRLHVLPRVFARKRKDTPVGVYEVRMRREQGRWFVELHPT